MFCKLLCPTDKNRRRLCSLPRKQNGLRGLASHRRRLRYVSDTSMGTVHGSISLIALAIPRPGFVKHFPGAINLHWTMDNTTDYTRVSIDFRLIPGRLFGQMKCGGSIEGGQKDVYRETEGYYSCCKLQRGVDGTCKWTSDRPLLPPDGRAGFPWTVKNWDKYKRKNVK